MNATTLDALASYTTPVQPDQNTEHENTSGQKRKRNTSVTQNSQEHEAHSSGQKDTNNTNIPPSLPRQTSHPHAPTPPARPLPTFNLPRFNAEHSPPQPSSPTSEAQKRRKLQTQKAREQDHAREHDEEMDVEETRVTDQGNNTPTPGANRNWFDQTPARPEGGPRESELNNAQENAVEIDEQENAKTLARIMAASDTPFDLDNGTAFPNPLDKYTQGPMPDIHDEDPATLLEGLDRGQIKSWLDLTTGKVLARPFDNVANYQPNQQRVAKTLMAAAKEITGAATVTVAPPNRDRSGPRQQGKRHPITFLIHGLSRRDVETLLERGVWSSKEITFQVAPINISRPKFLFTLSGLATQKEEDIAPILTTTWNDPITNALLQKLARKAPEPRQNNVMSKLVKFLESTVIQRLDIKTEGGKDDTHFNIYADGDIIEDDESWLELRKHLRSRQYKSNLFGEGTATKEDYICGLCHAHDHPRGLCPFPTIPRWNGGGRNQTKPSNTARGENRFQNGQPSGSREYHRDNYRYGPTNYSNRK
ncbi:hypothetical protein EDB86DRAFT_3078260 [Lactarius hatsudake]|nr:hypothetical protein EDB86DRAFT_3078260 [Lactarius hatsudake]